MPKYFALVELMDGRGFSTPIETKESYPIFERVYYWPTDQCPEIPAEINGDLINGENWDVLTYSNIVSIELIPQWDSVKDLIGKTEVEGQEWAKENGYEFRIIMQDGKSSLTDASMRKNRVNVYTSKGHIYRAEEF